MSVIGICGAVLFSAVMSVMIKSIRPEYSALITMITGTAVTVIAFASLTPVFEFVFSAAEKSAFSEYTAILFKITAIGFLTEITAGICSDAGESTLAEQVGFFGRGEILLLSLPLLRDAVNLAGKIAGK